MRSSNLRTHEVQPVTNAPSSLLKDKIRDWWADAPMTYGQEHGTTDYVRRDGSVERVEIGSRRFFELADERFYSWNVPLHTEAGPFGAIFPYDEMRGRRVLEIGCGMGCMAMNWAQRGALITAIDLNPTSIAQTKQRFSLLNLNADIRQADAEALPFDDASFDYVYSWGVLHHTPDTARAIEEIRRVLRPGGRTGVMLYHRDSILYRVMVQFQEGWLHRENQFLSPVELASRYADGGRQEGNPHTWPVTRRETRELFRNFDSVDVAVLGTDIPDILSAWKSGLGSALPKAMLRALAERFGWSLWIAARR
jgi:2-polyprenyl-3-methyl-5-hydroxy-6-metoxy-1,4-benzoquinol methylase